MKSFGRHINHNSAASLVGVFVAAVTLVPPVTVHAQSNAVVTSASASAVATNMPGAAASISRIAAGADTLHLLVGHSIFLNTKARLRRVYVADPTILTSYTLSPNQLIVTAMLPGTSSLVLLDEGGQAQSYVVSSDIDVSGLRVAMQDAMRDDVVHVEGQGNRVTLSGVVKSDALAETAMKLAALYSKEVANSMTVTPAHEKQVRLKVRILEVDRSKVTQFGVDLFNPGGPFVGSSTTSQFPSSASLTQGGPLVNGVQTNSLTVTDPLNFLLYNAKYNIGAVVKDLENKQVLQILAEPTITTISGQKANFLAGGEFPFPVIQPGGGAGTTASVTIMFRPYGVKLEFTPTVNEDGTIRLKVSPEVSALDYTNAVTISGYTIPALSTRRADTQVELRSDQSFAISGLLDKRTTDVLGRTPGAANIPILGALFRSKSINHSTSELVVIVTPTLVDPLEDGKPPSDLAFPIPSLDPGNFDQHFPGHKNVPAAPPAAPPASEVKEPQAPASNIERSGPAAVAANVPIAAPSVPLPGLAPATAVTVAHVVPPHVKQDEPTKPRILQANLSVPSPVAVPAPVTAATATTTSGRAVSSSAKSAIDSTGRLVEGKKIEPLAIRQQADPQHAMIASPNPGAQPAFAASARQSSATPLSVVQIVALSHKEDSDSMVRALQRQGYDVAVKQDSRDSLLHLQVGPFANKLDAEAMRQRLLDEGYNATVR